MGIKFNKNLNTELNDQIGHYNITTFKGSIFNTAIIRGKSLNKTESNYHFFLPVIT